MAQQLYDRTAEDLGNLVGLEHVNLRINNQGLAQEFYLSALGFTRDPYMFPGTNNMWVNVGNSQFHLPTGEPNVLRGHVGLVVPSLEELCERLGEAKKKLADTKFDCKQHNAYVEATCPWGNQFRLYEPDEERFGPINLGMPYVEFTVPEGTADGIARFYREIFYAPACVKENGEGRAAHVRAGARQELIFRETDKKLPEFDGHHLQVYAQEFSGPHDELEKRELITEESIAGRTSSASRPASTCSRSSTRCAAALTRCTIATWSTATHRRTTGITRWARTSGIGPCRARPKRSNQPRRPSPRRRWPGAAPPAWPRCRQRGRRTPHPHHPSLCLRGEGWARIGAVRAGSSQPGEKSLKCFDNASPWL
jgi:hypothetical protein